MSRLHTQGSSQYWRCCSLLFPGVFWAGIACAGDIYVDAFTGTDQIVCGAAANPCRSLDYAVERSSGGDTFRVAEGNYTGTGAQTCGAVVCVEGKVATIMGGYQPGNWANRDPSAFVTRIDGQGVRRGVSVRGLGQRAGLTLDGLQVVNGYAGGRDGDNLGGGIRASNADLVLRNVHLEANRAEGEDSAESRGISGAGGALNVSSCPLSPSVLGGTESPPEVLLENVDFIDNSAVGGDGSDRGGYALGGGLFAQRVRLTARNVSFRGNRAIAGSSSGVGIPPGPGTANEHADGLGGAMALMFGTSAEIESLEADSNEALGGNAVEIGGYGYGGAIYLEGRTEASTVLPGCPADSSPAYPGVEFELVSAWIGGNRAVGGSGLYGGGGKGGAVASYRAVTHIERSVIVDNHGISGTAGSERQQAAGGGIFLDTSLSRATIVNTVIADNSIDGDTGGGGGIRVLAADLLLDHVTLAANAIPAHNGIAIPGQAMQIGPRYDGGAPRESSVNIRNSLISDHAVTGKYAVHVMADSAAAFDKVLFTDNTPGNETNAARVDAGEISGLENTFYDSGAGFRSPGSPDHDYHLTANSPARDAAGVAAVGLDVDGQRRTDGSNDLGADEYCPYALDELTVSGNVELSGIQRRHACNKIFVSEARIVQGAAQTFKAGREVALGNGFAADAGSSFSAQLGLHDEVTGAAYRLSVTVDGNGTVHSTEGGIDCGQDCEQEYPANSLVELLTVADPLHSFVGWQGNGCSDLASCSLVMDGPEWVTAVFELDSYLLEVTLSGTGGGRVTSGPAGIDCGSECQAHYDGGTRVTLTPAVDQGSTFTGWQGGGCSGTGQCVVAMDRSRSVEAEFVDKVKLTVVTFGAGSGQVTSGPPGIICGSDCDEEFLPGTRVRLTPAADGNSVFLGWSVCGGTGTCDLVMDRDRSVTASFGLK